jgi:hypothetical protein
MKIYSIITACAEASTIGDLEVWLKELDHCGLSRETELLDGATLHPEGVPSLLEHVGYPSVTREITLMDLAEWIMHLYANGQTSETPLIDANDLAVDFLTKEDLAIESGIKRVLELCAFGRKFK